MNIKCNFNRSSNIIWQSLMVAFFLIGSTVSGLSQQSYYAKFAYKLTKGFWEKDFQVSEVVAHSGKRSLMIEGVVNKNTNVQEWTLSDTIMDQGKPLPFRMWVAPGTKHVRGLILAAKVMAEEDFVINPAIRKVAAEENLAIIKTDGKEFAMFDLNKGEDVLFLKVLHKCAARSGFPEIEFAPWLTFGHSTAGHFAKNLAYWKPERTFGILYFKSGQFHSPIWVKPGTSLHNIPILTISGQLEEFGPHGTLLPNETPQSQWFAIRDTLMQLRQSGHLVSMIVEPNGGHFSLSQKVADYMALFIKKASQAKIPANTFATKAPVRLNEIKESQGVLSDTCISKLITHPDSSFSNLYMPFNKFPNKKVSFWHFDKEMAKAWVRFHQSNNYAY